MTGPPWILLTRRNVSEEVAEKIIEQNFMLSIFFFENCIVYEKKWKNRVEPARPQMPIQ